MKKDEQSDDETMKDEKPQTTRDLIWQCFGKVVSSDFVL